MQVGDFHGTLMLPMTNPESIIGEERGSLPRTYCWQVVYACSLVHAASGALPAIECTRAAPAGVRIQPGRYAGYTVMHCHFLNHEDMG